MEKRIECFGSRGRRTRTNRNFNQFGDELQKEHSYFQKRTIPRFFLLDLEKMRLIHLPLLTILFLSNIKYEYWPWVKYD